MLISVHSGSVLIRTLAAAGAGWGWGDGGGTVDVAILHSLT